MFTKLILSLCAGLIAVSPAFALPPEPEFGVNLRNNNVQTHPSTSHESREETAEKARARLAKLWEASFCHSEDLQFITQKVLGGKVSVSEILKAISHPGSSAVWAIADREDPGYPDALRPVPDSGDPRLSSCGYSCLRRLCTKNGQRLSQTESMMLFKMLRDAADALTSAYSDYLSARAQLKTREDSINVQTTGLGTALETSRKKLIALAGSQAVAELDSDLEQNAKDKTDK